MKKYYAFFAAVIILSMHCAGIAQTSQRWVTAYHPTWWYGTMKPSQIDFSSMTHIAIFPAQDASASAPYFNSTGIDDGSDFPQIVTMAHAKGVKVLISACGGYGQVNMPVVAADPVKCQAFVDAACSFAKSKNADGIELDWEFPRASDDVGWNRLIRLFRQKLDTWSPKGVFATSMFYSIGGASSSPYYRDSMMVFDQINLMSYTMWMGSSAGPFKSGYDTPVNLPSGVSGYNGWALNSSGGGPLTFIAAGYPASKLGLGVSFEGTRFDGVTGLGQAYTSWGFTSSVTSPLGSGYAAIPTSGRVWDPVAQANYCVSGSTVYSFQDTNSVKAISNWAKDQSWGGVMIYDLGTGYDKSAAVPDAMLKVAGRITLGAGSTVPVAAPTGTFKSSASTLPAGGGTVTLTWTSMNAASAIIDQGVGTVAVNGSTTVSVTATKTFTLTLMNAAGASVSYTVPITVAIAAVDPAPTPSPDPATTSQAVVIYNDNALTSPWSTDGSYAATLDFANKEKVLKGATSLKVVGSAWGAVQFRHGTWNGTTTVDVTKVDSLHMAIYGGTAGVQLSLNLANASGSLIGTQMKFTAPANVWTIKSIAMSQLNAAKTAFTLINMQVYQSSASTFYIDDLNLVANTAPVVVPVPAPAGTFTSSVASLPDGGGTVTLAWSSTNAVAASIDQGVGTVALNGSAAVAVASTKTFTLTLANSAGVTATYSVTVSVAPPVAPKTVISSIRATDGGAGVLLSWSTASEVKNAGFDIQRKKGTGAYAKIGFVAAKGSSSAPASYQYTDNLTKNGVYTYRLRQINTDGISTYSPETSINLVRNVVTTLTSYPNPFNPTTNISFTAEANGHATMKIFNVIGQEVATLFNGEVEAGIEHVVAFNASALASGLYISVLEIGGVRMTHKLLLSK